MEITERMLLTKYECSVIASMRAHQGAVDKNKKSQDIAIEHAEVAKAVEQTHTVTSEIDPVANVMAKMTLQIDNLFKQIARLDQQIERMTSVADERAFSTAEALANLRVASDKAMYYSESSNKAINTLRNALCDLDDD